MSGISQVFHRLATEISSSWIWRYGTAVPLVAAALLIRLSLNFVLGVRAPYLPFVLALMFAARIGGRGPGFLATAVSAVCVQWFFLEPQRSLQVSDPQDIAGLAWFVAIGTLISFFVGNLRATLHMAAKSRGELEASQARLKLAQRAGRSGTFDWDATSDVTLWSDELLDLYGLKRADLGGTSEDWLQHVVPDDRSSALAARQRSLETGQFEIEFRIQKRNTGEIRWMYGRADVLFDQDGRPARMIGLHLDITDLKQVEEALRHSLERLERVLDNDTVGVMFWDLNTGTLVDANDTFLKLMGYSRSDVEARDLSWQKLTPPEYMDVRRAEVEKFLTTGRVGPYEKEYFRKDGTRRWLLFAGSSLGNNQCVEFCVDISDRKQAEATVRESERRYRALFESMQEGFALGEMICDSAGEPVDWRYLDVNPAFETMFGIRREHVVGRTYRELFPDAPWEYWVPALGRVALTGDPARLERFGAETGRHYEAMAYSPKPGQFGAIFADITDRKHAEEALRQSELFHRQTLESIPGMVFTTRPDGYCDYQSQQWVEYSGVPMEEHLGDGWNKLLHPDDQARALAAWQAAVTERAPYDLEYRVRRYDGAYEWFKVIGRPIRDAAGQIVRWFGVALNIESLKRAESALQQALQQRQLAFEAANLGAWDYRLDTGEVQWDERSQKIFGATGDDRFEYGEAIARIHPQDRQATDEAIQQAIAGENGGAYRHEFRVKWPDGSVHWVAGHGQVLFEGTAGGSPRAVRFLGVNMDVTERKMAEERLREEQKIESIGLLAGGVAHDFNNLLTVIAGHTELALRQRPACENSQAVLEAANRAAFLTKQLLAYAGKGTTTTEIVDVSDRIKRSTELLRASVPRRVELRFRLADNLPCVEQDPSRLDQILMNLVINAGEAIPPRSDGGIEVNTSSCDVSPEAARVHSRGYLVEPGLFVCLEVRDTGIGMDEETRAKVFDPFFSTKFAGRGLGLAAVYGVVRSAKGFVELESSPGTGATFRVYLPATDKPRTTPSLEAQALNRQRPQQDSTILVVDDEEMVRKLAGVILHQHGYQVLEAKNGEDALRVLAEASVLPSVVLLDLAMPVMGGDELVPIVAREYPGLRIVLTSGYPEEQARRDFQSEAVTGFLQKPYRSGTLIEKIQDALGRGDGRGGRPGPQARRPQ
jgi:PAS domain S-box-containing protein